MNTIEAWENLFKGKRIKRKSWGKGEYIFLKEGKLFSYDRGEDNLVTTHIFGESTYEDIWEFCKEPILDKKEKEYLENALKPFKNRIESIYKCYGSTFSKEQIGVVLKGDPINWFFPTFEYGLMYKGMELNKEYTIKELGLFKKIKKENGK